MLCLQRVGRQRRRVRTAVVVDDRWLAVKAVRPASALADRLTVDCEALLLTCHDLLWGQVASPVGGDKVVQVAVAPRRTGRLGWFAAHFRSSVTDAYDSSSVTSR